MNLYSFQGSAILQEGTDMKELDLGIQNFVPRGSVVRNATVMAIVVYTGIDTKIVMNQGKVFYKTTRIDRDLNKIYWIQLV